MPISRISTSRPAPSPPTGHWQQALTGRLGGRGRHGPAAMAPAGAVNVVMTTAILGSMEILLLPRRQAAAAQPSPRLQGGDFNVLCHWHLEARLGRATPLALAARAWARDLGLARAKTAQHSSKHPAPQPATGQAARWCELSVPGDYHLHMSLINNKGTRK